MLLKIGSKGDEVLKLQSRLNSPSPDGVFGKATDILVKTFQRENGLLADGKVGQSTWDRLFPPVIGDAVTSGTSVTGAAHSDLRKLKGLIPMKVIEQLIAAPQLRDKNNVAMSHFLSQCCEESQCFTVTRENLNYDAHGLRTYFHTHFEEHEYANFAHKPERIGDRVYGNRMGNNATNGYENRGAGYIQTTGGDNLRELGIYLGVDVLSNPQIVADKYPLESALFFFDHNRIWPHAYEPTYRCCSDITHRVNGGQTHLKERWEYFQSIHKRLTT